MRLNKTISVLTALLALLLVSASCAAQTTQTPSGSASATPSQKAPSSSPVPSAAQPASPTPSVSADKPKNATWVVDVNDTQKYTDDKGIIWNYKLTFHASKPGGTNVTGEYAGDVLPA